MSESEFYARDIEQTYQYSSFGVPDLGYKRGLAESIGTCLRVDCSASTGRTNLLAAFPRIAPHFIRGYFRNLPPEEKSCCSIAPIIVRLRRFFAGRGLLAGAELDDAAAVAF